MILNTFSSLGVSSITQACSKLLVAVTSRPILAGVTRCMLSMVSENLTDEAYVLVDSGDLMLTNSS